MPINPRSIAVDAEGAVVIEELVVLGFGGFFVIHYFDFEWGHPPRRYRMRFDHLEGGRIV